MALLNDEIIHILKLLSTHGSYEGGEVRVFNEICKIYGLEYKYDDFYWLTK